MTMKILFIFCCIFLSEARSAEALPTVESELVNENLVPTTATKIEDTDRNANIEEQQQAVEEPVVTKIEDRSGNEDETSKSDIDTDSKVSLIDRNASEDSTPANSVLERTGAKEDNAENSEETGKVERMQDEGSDEDSYELSEEVSEEDSIELFPAAPLDNTRRKLSDPLEKSLKTEKKISDKNDEELEQRAGFAVKPIITVPHRPKPIPTVIPVGLPKPHAYSTPPIPYRNPMIPNYPNPSYMNGFPYPPYRNFIPNLPMNPRPNYSPLIDQFNSEPHNNAYPFAASTSKPQNVYPQDMFPKDLYAKLMQASEHPIPYYPNMYNAYTGLQRTYHMNPKDVTLDSYPFKRS